MYNLDSALHRGKTIPKDKSGSGDWHYGFLTKVEESWYITEKGKSYEVDPNTVGRFTCVYDENCEQIYEGDIVQLVNFQKGVVTHCCGSFGIGIMPYIDWDYLDSEIAPRTGCNNTSHFCCNDNYISLWEIMWNYNCEEDYCNAVEIIGNIHDNPELLHK